MPGIAPATIDVRSDGIGPAGEVNTDKAGKVYWENVWQETKLPLPVNPRDTTWRNYVNRQLHAFFADSVPKIVPRHGRILELGCAYSAWLPYFTREFELDPWGLDYVEAGCAAAREIMRRADLPADQIVCGDLFNPPASMLGAFDLVTSFGLVEHFQNTADCIRECSRFLKPHGAIITLIPNMHGVTGFLQKHMSRVIFDKHVPLDLEQLACAHREAQLVELRAAYLVPFNFGVVNPGNFATPMIRTLVSKCGNGFTALLGVLHEAGVPLKPNRFTSPFIVCVFGLN
jgi:SAM-dependent methyltransferase